MPNFAARRGKIGKTNVNLRSSVPLFFSFLLFPRGLRSLVGSGGPNHGPGPNSIQE